MKQTTSRFSGIILALLLLLLAGVGYFEFVQPAYANLMMLRGQEQAERAFLASEQTIATKAQSVLADYQGQSSSTQAMNMALPIGPDSANAITQLYGLASASGLTVQSVGVSQSAAPQSAVQPAAANGSSVVTAASLIKPYGTLTFQVTAMGSYESLKTFLQGLENNVRLFDVSALSIQPVTSVTSGGAVITGTQDLYNYTLSVVAYYQPS